MSLQPKRLATFFKTSMCLRHRKSYKSCLKGNRLLKFIINKLFITEAFFTSLILCFYCYFSILDCSNTTESGVLVSVEETFQYNSSGTFICEEGFLLYNKTAKRKPDANKTFCEATAMWKNEQNFLCVAGIY